MIRISLTLLLLIAAVSATYGQNRARFHHRIKKTEVDRGYLKIGYKDSSGTFHRVTLCRPYHKAIITLDKGVPQVDFWSLVQSEQQEVEQVQKAAADTCLNNKTPIRKFEIDLSPRKTLGDPTRYIKVPFRAWTWGVGTTPFRYRPKADSSFATVSANLSASVNFGRTFGTSTISPRAINNRSITVGAFLGVSTADLKKSTVKRPSSWTTDRTNIAVNYGINAVLARNNFGLVFSIGADHNFGENAKEWSYQDKLWFGLGINTGLGIF